MKKIKMKLKSAKELTVNILMGSGLLIIFWTVSTFDKDFGNDL